MEVALSIKASMKAVALESYGSTQIVIMVSEFLMSAWQWIKRASFILEKETVSVLKAI